MTTSLLTAACGRRLAPGEEAVLRVDTILCSDCAGWLPHDPQFTDRPFRLTRGAACGGGSPLD